LATAGIIHRGKNPICKKIFHRNSCGSFFFESFTTCQGMTLRVLKYLSAFKISSSVQNESVHSSGDNISGRAILESI